MSIENVLYRAHAEATGGREGRAVAQEGGLDLKLTRPKGLGGKGEKGTNPEELFAAGCELLISITSSGQISALGEPPYFILIDRALRDEGTSYHYLPPSDFSAISSPLGQRVQQVLQASSLTVHLGATWTTDAPFRETEAAIQHAQTLGILAVEMEAAALYAFAEAKQVPVACFAHVTNQMAQKTGDFEKGADNGSYDALQLIDQVATLW